MNVTSSLDVASISASELQIQADMLRETGDSLKAINLYNQAIASYQADRDYSPMISALTGRLLCWKHLFIKTQDKIYAIFVNSEAEAMQAIATEHQLHEKFYLIHFLRATSALLLNNAPLAETEFRIAIERHADNAEKGDWMAQLGEALYKNGKKEEGRDTILHGINKIQEHASEVDSFLLNVWISGAYLRLATLLCQDSKEESQNFLAKAKEIIESDERLIIRKQQLEICLKNFARDS